MKYLITFLYSGISKTSSTPKRNEKRLNLRKRALAGRSKPGSPAPSKNGRHI